MNKNIKNLLYSLLLIILALIALFLIKYGDSNAQDEYHIHTDFKVYLNGEFYNFSQEEYMSGINDPYYKFVHLHDMNGNVIHYHANDMDLVSFFSTINMKLNNTCFVLDNGTQYCNNDNMKLRFIVNGQEVTDILSYNPQDLDKVLIAYVQDDENITELYTYVTDIACIQSLTCPEKGEPSNESSCAGSSCAYSIN